MAANMAYRGRPGNSENGRIIAENQGEVKAKGRNSAALERVRCLDKFAINERETGGEKSAMGKHSDLKKTQNG
jgi:hypothetical protein